MTPVETQSTVHSLSARTAAWHLQLFLLDLAGQREAVQVGLNAPGLLNGKPAVTNRQCPTWQQILACCCMYCISLDGRKEL